ncbi:LEA type 2 family protein [Gracilinema caldarium]|uniref:NDR1/HIN1-like protein n=1 Tax=Gracilinema caldarium TaxID=215591 RepID=UPI0026E95A7D|nr:LEA type 2 family protein [Gracilinema caldarium]
MQKVRNLLLMILVGSVLSCVSVKKIEAPVPPPPVLEPVPQFSVGLPMPESGGELAVLFKVPLKIENPGKDAYTLQKLEAQAILHLADQDLELKTQLVSAEQEPVQGTTINPHGSFTWFLAVSVPLEQVLSHFTEPASASSHPDGANNASKVFDVSAMAMLFDPRGKVLNLETKTAIPMPQIFWPVVRVLSIAVKRAELINTRLKVRLLIENHNNFPLTLSRFSYELYGNGRFWADGSFADLFTVQGNESLEKDIYLLMNFINMKRDLLDQVIALKSVQYRFHGDLRIESPLLYLPAFPYAFDRQGSSPVIE